jgi:hypothetical protein
LTRKSEPTATALHCIEGSTSCAAILLLHELLRTRNATLSGDGVSILLVTPIGDGMILWLVASLHLDALTIFSGLLLAIKGRV